LVFFLFFTDCFLPQAAPILLFFWLCAFIKNRTLPKRVHEIDIDVRLPFLPSLRDSTDSLPFSDSQTGRKSWLTAEEMNLYRAERRNAPFLTRYVLSSSLLPSFRTDSYSSVL
jgi:hypothetical protein